MPKKPTQHAIEAAADKVVRWMAERLWIVDMAGERVPLALNHEQQTVLAVAMAQRLSGLPIRIIVLKARKVGISTFTEAFGYMECDCNPHRRGLVCAQDSESSSALWTMTRRYYENDAESKPTLGRGPTQRHIQWAQPHDSSMAVRTAGTETLQRGDTLHFLHCSEMAFWPYAETTALSVLNAVSKAAVSCTIIESTANGVGGAFYARWQDAVKRVRERPGDVDGFVPLFFSWLDHPDYSRPLPEGYDLDDLDDFERDLVNVGATPEQLYWRRQTLANECGGDPELFCQEYPHTPEVAFRTSGRPAIPQAVQSWHRKTIAEAPAPHYIRFEWDRIKGPPIIWAREADPGEEFAWTVWEPVRYDSRSECYQLTDPIADYCLFADITQGDLSDPTNERSASDRDAVFVLNRAKLWQSAMLVGRFPQDLLGEQLAMAGWWFRGAFVTPEINIDTTALNRMRELQYPRLYVRLKGDQTPEAMLRRLPEAAYGWKTTTANRDEMIDDWIRWNRPDDGDTASILRVYDPALMHEESTFTWMKEGTKLKRRHANGEHDDILFSAMGCLQMHLRCPRQRRPRATERGTLRKDGPAPWRWAGGVDPGFQRKRRAGRTS